MKEECIDKSESKTYDHFLWKRTDAKGNTTYRVETEANIIYKRYRAEFYNIEEAQDYFNKVAKRKNHDSDLDKKDIENKAFECMKGWLRK